MQALLKGKTKLRCWFKKTANLLIKRAKKETRKLKGQTPKLTSWKIIKLIA